MEKSQLREPLSNNITYKSLNYMRFAIFKLCKKADAMLAVEPEGDFDSLCYLTTD